MATSGAQLQGANNQLVQIIEDLKDRRSAVMRAMDAEERERQTILNDIKILQERLTRIDASIKNKKSKLSEYNNNILETQRAYEKILHSTQGLLHVLRSKSAQLNNPQNITHSHIPQFNTDSSLVSHHSSNFNNPTHDPEHPSHFYRHQDDINTFQRNTNRKPNPEQGRETQYVEEHPHPLQNPSSKLNFNNGTHLQNQHTNPEYIPHNPPSDNIPIHHSHHSGESPGQGPRNSGPFVNGNGRAIHSEHDHSSNFHGPPSDRHIGTPINHQHSDPNTNIPANVYNSYNVYSTEASNVKGNQPSTFQIQGAGTGVSSAAVDHLAQMEHRQYRPLNKPLPSGPPTGGYQPFLQKTKDNNTPSVISMNELSDIDGSYREIHHMSNTTSHRDFKDNLRFGGRNYSKITKPSNRAFSTDESRKSFPAGYRDVYAERRHHKSDPNEARPIFEYRDENAGTRNRKVHRHAKNTHSESKPKPKRTSGSLKKPPKSRSQNIKTQKKIIVK